MNKIKELFSIDLRTLAFLRISLALVLMYDLAWRSMDLYAHYTDHGVLPRFALLASFYYKQFWSIYFIDGNLVFTISLFFLNAIFLSCLFLGYRTRMMTFLCWILLVSLHNRNPLVLTGGDTILRLFLFWSIFLPLGAVWSMDASKKKENPSLTFFSIGTVAFCLQFVMIYFFAWASKISEQWWPQGTAVYYALGIEYMTTHWGALLRQAPTDLLKIFTYSVYWFECLVPILFLLRPVRMLLAVLLILMHIAFAVTLELGIFPLAGILTAIILIPGSFWDRCSKKKEQEQVGENPAAHFSLSIFEKVFICICLLSTLLFNIEGMRKWPSFLSPTAKQFIQTVRINQSWAMFSPKPSQSTGWYVVEAVAVEGKRIDLINNGKDVSYSKPSNISTRYGNCRWRKFFNNLGRKSFARYRRYYADYLAKKWNASHADNPIESLSLIYFRQRNFGDHIRSNPKKIVLLNNYRANK